MLYRRGGYPEESEILICTVTKIYHHSVFANLDEYDTTGMIHISEISPGRIRNIRDFVQEGKKVICKVLRVNKEKGHIDLSLRRVTESQRRHKINEIKQEQKAEAILDFVCKKNKTDMKKTYDKLTSTVFAKYPNLSSYFQKIAMDEASMKEAGLDAKISKDLEEAIRQRIKPPEVLIGGKLKLVSYSPEGVEIVKKVLEHAKPTDDKQVELKYDGAGKYKILVRSEDYKTAEKILKDIVDTIIEEIEEKDGEGSFERVEIKKEHE